MSDERLEDRRFANPKTLDLATPFLTKMFQIRLTAIATGMPAR